TPQARHGGSAVSLIGVRGGIAGDFTVTRLAEDEFMIIGGGMSERYHSRFWKEVPLPAGTTFESRTDTMCGFNVAGPQSRALLARLTNADLSSEAFPFMRSQRITVAGVDVIALRVSFTGDLGWELHCDQADQLRLYQALLEAGRAMDAGPVGSRALMSLRIEKGYGSWSREYSPEYWPQEVGLDRLIKLDKEFLNKASYLKIKDNAPREMLSLIEVQEVTDADATGGEPIFLTDGTPVGRVTSGTYGYSVGKSLALGYLKHVAPGTPVDVMILGKPHRGVVLAEPPFDPAGTKLRA
ncbi:MAG: aminomethyltransferase family protein, partial [Paracoccaceae bacterium]|nr:aminomethyltransferase family protein [Paracoccaceae bacterium]